MRINIYVDSSFTNDTAYKFSGTTDSSPFYTLYTHAHVTCAPRTGVTLSTSWSIKHSEKQGGCEFVEGAVRVLIRVIGHSWPYCGIG